MLVVIFRGKKGKRGSSEWELESTWGIGIEPRSGWDDDFDVLSAPNPDIEAKLISAAQNIQSVKTASVPTPDMSAQVPGSQTGSGSSTTKLDNFSESQKNKDIDTSFLDDLL